MSERLYYSDSFLRSFSSRVTDIRELSRTDGQSVWQVALERTAFYPTSGGQPYDLGVITATSRSGAVLEAPVVAVEEDEHGEVWHQTLKPLLAGTEVRGEIDWARRLDHMQQHTGQHLLSAIFLRELHAPTVSFHLGETSSTIDLASDSPAHHSLERVERIANELIAENRAVTVRTVGREEADALLAAGTLRKLPEREGTIRLIEITDCDLNACGGTHVRSTGQIGSLLLRSAERVSRGLRVEFLCGLRAVAAARHDFALLGRAAAALSIGPNDIPAVIARFQSEAKSSAKERQKLREELAGYHATRLAIEVMIQDNLRLVRRTFPDRDREYVRLLASRVCATVPRTVTVFISAESDPVRILLACSHDIDLNCGAFLREALAAHGLRGGGSRDLAQGDLPRDQAEDVATKLAANLRFLLARPHHDD